MRREIICLARDTFGISQIGFDLGWQCVQVGQDHLRKKRKVFSLLRRGFIQFVQRLIAFQANLMSPLLQIFCDEAFLRKFVDSLIKFPCIHFIGKKFSAHVYCPSEHGDRGTIATIFQIIHSFHEGPCDRGWDMFRAFAFGWLGIDVFYRKGPLRSDIARVVFDIRGRRCGVKPYGYRLKADWASSVQISQLWFQGDGYLKRDIKRGISCAAVRAIQNENSHDK